MKEHITNCIKCWRRIKVVFNPPIKRINCIEVECCNVRSNERINILIVDDDESILNIVKRVVKKLSFDVYSTTSSAQALYSYLPPEEKAFKVLLTDIDMPGINGIEFIKRLRSRGQTVKTIGMSGRNIKEKDLFDRFLNKPFTIEELRTSITELI